MVVIGLSLTALQFKLFIHFLLILADIAVNSFIEYSFERTLKGVSNQGTVFSLLVGQIMISAISISWFFVLMWGTLLLRIGLLGMLFKEFRINIIIYFTYFVVLLIERIIRIMKYLDNEEWHEITIWDAMSYQIAYFARFILAPFFYFFLFQGALKLAKIDYYNTQTKRWNLSL